MAKEIKDFGQKIGGARKDFYANALCADDLLDMNEAEIQKHVKRDSIWKREDPVKLVESGVPQVVAYWQNEMRTSIPPKPTGYTEELVKAYVDTVSALRDMVLAVETPNGIDRFYMEQFRPAFIVSGTSPYRVHLIEPAKGIIMNRTMTAAQMSAAYAAAKAKNKHYGLTKENAMRERVTNSIVIARYGHDLTFDDQRADQVCLKHRTPGCVRFYYVKEDSDLCRRDYWKEGTYAVMDCVINSFIACNLETEEEAKKAAEDYTEGILELRTRMDAEAKEKKKTKKKEKFPIPELASVKRVAPEYLDKPMTGERFLTDFHIRGGEFGNWMSDADAQASLDHCYEAFVDLARILDIPYRDISFGGDLSIGFGSRGHSAAMAHYEPDRQVINLTKHKGAGALAHEWAHALDDAIGKRYMTKFHGMASQHMTCSELPLKLREIFSMMCWRMEKQDEEELEQQKEAVIRQKRDRFFDMLRSQKPRHAEEDTWNALVEALWKDRKRVSEAYLQDPAHSQYDTESIHAISEYRKSCGEKALSKETRRVIMVYCSGAVMMEESQKPNTIMRKNTEFLAGSKTFDQYFQKQKHGYWSSITEMFARAFDCYVVDKLKERGEMNEYLTAYADTFFFPHDGKLVYAVPMGEEREILNKLFDELIVELKETGFF